MTSLTLNGQRTKISWERTLLTATVTQVKWNGLMVNLDQILDWFQETDRIERIMDTFISTLPKASIWKFIMPILNLWFVIEHHKDSTNYYFKSVLVVTLTIQIILFYHRFCTHIRHFFYNKNDLIVQERHLVSVIKTDFISCESWLFRLCNAAVQYEYDTSKSILLWIQVQ